MDPGEPRVAGYRWDSGEHRVKPIIVWEPPPDPPALPFHAAGGDREEN
jgi:hypothetical protein